MTPYCLIYVTCTSKKEAQSIAKKLIELRLAACVNILGKSDSLYRWKSKVEKGTEWPILIKTRKSYFLQITQWVKKMHKFTVPAIIEIPIDRGEPHFMEWIKNESRK